MKAAPRFLSAVSAAALAIAPAAGGAAAVQLVTTAGAHAAVVTSISVRGNQRVSEQTIAEFVGYRSGRNYSGSDINDAVRALFRSGLFSNVSIVTSGAALVVTVEEFATVNQVLFQGNRRLDDDRLRAVVQLAPRGRFEQATLDVDVEALVEAYSRTGRGDVTVNASAVDLGENRVNVIFQIVEGDRTRIARITFTGNNAFSDRRLQAVISTKPSNPLSWLTRNDIYDDQRLAADEEALRRFYFDRGYADFRIISSAADVDPSTGNIVINIEVDEGDRYTFGGIDIDTTVTGVDPEALARTISTRSGSVYSAREVEDTLINMSERLAGAGFPFAEVTPVGNRDFDNRTIDVTYIVDQGQRAFIERIEIVGNTRTRDYVIRREFDLAEGDAFNQVLIRRAQRRLEALDFFTRVQISTRPGSSADRVVVVVQVEDKPTGEFGVGLGYSTGGQNEGVNAEASVTERNFLGRGQAIRVGVGGSVATRTYNLSFTEPYFLGYRVAATFGLYQNRNDLGDYERRSTGGSVSFGLPLTDHLTANVGYNYQRDVYRADGPDCTDLPGDADNNCGAPAFVQPRIVSGQPRVKSSVIYGLVYNTIDNRSEPRSGLFVRLNQEVAGLGGDARFIRTTADASYYVTLLEDAELVGLVRGGAGNIAGLGARVEGFDQFEIGPRRLRGFAFNGIGPTDTNGSFIGGTSYINATAEMQFPLPAFPRDLGFKGAVFADAATLFGSDVANAQNTSLAWRASAGLSVIWQSPFAPLRFDYAWPLVKQAHDKEQRFSFSVSTAF